MSLLCPDCANREDEDSPYCSRCGHDLVRSLRQRSVPVSVSRQEVVIDRFKVNCVCYGEQLRFDPVDEIMSSVFRCGRFQQRVDCIACPICTKCGQLKCTCGFLGISIDAKIKGTAIETVPLRDRLV
jgi:hypothetical protein